MSFFLGEFKGGVLTPERIQCFSFLGPGEVIEVSEES